MKRSMQKQKDKLVFLCALVYFTSYLTRVNFAAVLVEIIRSDGFARTAVSVAPTGLFITYGAGQLVSGYLGDRVEPHHLIFLGLFVCALMNALIPFCPNPRWMTLVWSVNGFAQALIWPPQLRILSQYLTVEEYKRATVKVSWGGSLGTIFVYLTAPLFIASSGWRAVFFASALVALVVTGFWCLGYRRLEGDLEPVVRQSYVEARGAQERPIFPFMGMLLLILFSIVLQGMLKDGITTWMPTYLSDIYRTGSGKAIFTSVLLPVFSMVSHRLVLYINYRLIPNEMLCSGVLFFLCFVALLLLNTVASGLAAAVLSLAVAVGSIHGVNLIQTCMLPQHFLRYGRISLVSGVLNSCSYLGSTLSIFGIAAVTEKLGWNATLFSWCGIALVGGLLCLSCARRWEAFKQ